MLNCSLSTVGSKDQEVCLKSHNNIIYSIIFSQFVSVNDKNMLPLIKSIVCVL